MSTNIEIEEKGSAPQAQTEYIHELEGRCTILESDLFKTQTKLRTAQNTITKLENLNTLNAKV